MFRQHALDRLSSPEQLDHLLRFQRSRGGWALATMLVLVAVALVWGFRGAIPIEITGKGTLLDRGTSLEAILFVPADSARGVRPGMQVRFLPFSLPSGTRGHLRGRVARVGGPSICPGDAQTVVVVLEHEPRGIASGTPLTGRILLRRERPLDLLLPSTRKALGG